MIHGETIFKTRYYDPEVRRFISVDDPDDLYEVLLKLACDKDELVRTEAYDSLSGFPLPEIGLFLKKAIQTEKDGLACSYAISSWVENALSLFEEHSDDIVFIKEILELEKIKNQNTAC